MPLPVYEFGDVRVDLARVTVTREGRPVALEPKTFDVLCFLIEHRRRLTRFTSASGYVRYPSWSPQGRRIVFERSQRTGSVWSVVLK